MQPSMQAAGAVSHLQATCWVGKARVGANLRQARPLCRLQRCVGPLLQHIRGHSGPLLAARAAAAGTAILVARALAAAIQQRGGLPLGQLPAAREWDA